MVAIAPTKSTARLAAENDALRRELDVLRDRLGPVKPAPRPQEVGPRWDSGFADLLPDAAYVHVDGRIVAINAAGVTQFGAARAEEIIGRDNFDFIHPDHHAKAREHMLRGRAGRRRATFLHAPRRRIDGSEYPAEISASRCRWGDADGELVIVRDLTEHVQAEKALRESEGRFRDLAESLAEIVVETNERGVLTFLNRRGMTTSGYTEEDLRKGLNTLDLVVPEERQRVRENMMAVMAGRDLGEIEYTGVRKDGTRYPVTVHSSPLYRDGKIVGLTATVVDITERKKAEAALRESEQRFRLLAEASFDTTLVMEDGVIRDVNENASELYGYTRDEIIGQRASLLAAPNEQGRVAWRVSRQVDGRYESAIRRKDGETVQVEVSARHFVRDGHRIRISSIRDISERKRAETALRDSEERFRSVFELSPDAIYVNIGGRIVFANPATARMFGYDRPEELIGVETLTLYHPEAHDLVRTRRDLMLVNRKIASSAEHRCRRRDGSAFDVEVRAAKLVWCDAPAILVFVRDISDRKKFEAELIRRGSEAEAANHAKSQFLAAMSHELRTPLNAIIGFSQTIEMQAFGPIGDPHYLEYAKDINESGQHLHALINDILDLAKVESGKDELHEERVDVADNARSVLTLVGQRAELHGVSLRLEIEDGLPALRADPRKLKQILVNLLTNAIKFTDPGGQVTLAVERPAAGGLVFRVADTGIGIAPEDIPKALSQFGQVRKGPEYALEGTGLGLPLTKALVEQHGGRLELQSEVGRGTTVTIRFPPARLEPDAADPAQAPGIARR